MIEVDFSQEDRSNSKQSISGAFYNNARDKSGSGPTVKTSSYDRDHPLVTLVSASDTASINDDQNQGSCLLDRSASVIEP